MGKPILKEYYLKSILYAVVIVLLNVAGLNLFFRFDLTANRIYSLSDASKQAVSTLSEPLNIKVFFSKNLPAPHNNTERYLRDLLTEYAAQAGRYFNFTFYNVSQETDMGDKANQNREMARDYGISPVQNPFMARKAFIPTTFSPFVATRGKLLSQLAIHSASPGRLVYANTSPHISVTPSMMG